MTAVTRVPGLLVGLALAALTLRPQVVGIGPILPDVQADLGTSHTVAGLLVTIPVLAMGLFAPPAASLALRLGATRAVTLALALVALGGVGRALAPGVVAVIALTVPIGIGMGLGNALMVVAVKERFADRPLLVTGIYTTAMQIGSTVAAAIAVPVADAAGTWRAATLVLGLAAVGSLVGWAWLVRGDGSSVAGSAARAAAIAAPVRPRFPLNRLLAWQLVGLFALMGQIFYGLTAWLPNAYQEQGFSAAQTGLLSAILNLGCVPASIVTAAFGHRVSRRTGLVSAGVLMLAATFLLVVATGGAYVWMFAAGWANGTLFTLGMTMPLDVADTPGDVGAVAGMMLGIGYTAIAVAPIGLGALRDLTGGFEAVLVAIVIAAAALVGVSLTCSAPRLARGLRLP